MPDEPIDRIVKIDEEIDFTMSQIQVCSSLPPDKRALATTRLHWLLHNLEEARWVLAQRAFPEAVESIKAMTFEVPGYERPS